MALGEHETVSVVPVRGGRIDVHQIEVQRGDDFVNALRRADQSMYQIKHTGKNGAAIGHTLLSLSYRQAEPT